MRIMKWAVMALTCCTLLGGCAGTNTTGDSAANTAAPPQEQVEMAVPEKGIPVLMYHMIGDVPDNDAVLLESHFREQMKFLKDNGFHPITLQQLYEYMTKGSPVPVNPVVLTFDDGYPDTYSIVTPVMEEYGFPCTVFIPTRDADDGARLTWDQITEMQKRGISISSHSYEHIRLAELSPAAIDEQVRKSQEELKKHLGSTNEFFCYPYGRENPVVEEAMKKHGIKLAFTMNPGWAKKGDNPYAVKRIWIGNAVDIENFKQRITTEHYEER